MLLFIDSEPSLLADVLTAIISGVAINQFIGSTLFEPTWFLPLYRAQPQQTLTNIKSLKLFCNSVQTGLS